MSGKDQVGRLAMRTAYATHEGSVVLSVEGRTNLYFSSTDLRELADAIDNYWDNQGDSE